MASGRHVSTQLVSRGARIYAHLIAVAILEQVILYDCGMTKIGKSQGPRSISAAVTGSATLMPACSMWAPLKVDDS